MLRQVPAAQAGCTKLEVFTNHTKDPVLGMKARAFDSAREFIQYVSRETHFREVKVVFDAQQRTLTFFLTPAARFVPLDQALFHVKVKQTLVATTGPVDFKTYTDRDLASMVKYEYMTAAESSAMVNAATLLDFVDFAALGVFAPRP